MALGARSLAGSPAGANPPAGAWDGAAEPWQLAAGKEDRPLSNVFATMLKQLRVPTEKFADSDGLVKELLTQDA